MIEEAVEDSQRESRDSVHRMLFPDVLDAVTGKWEVGDLLRFPQLVTVSESPRQVDEMLHVEQEVARIVEEAVAAVDEMRLKEGEFLQSDLSERIRLLSGLVKDIEQTAGESDDSLRERLTQRVDELAPDLGTNGAVVVQEVVRFVLGLIFMKNLHGFGHI